MVEAILAIRDEDTESHHKRIGLTPNCTAGRARREAEFCGGVAASLARKGQEVLAYDWARAAASFALVIVGRD
jgi:hypothetical protein